MDERQGRVRAAGSGEAAPLAEMLGRAFFDDPVFEWLFADDAVRRRRISAVFRVLLGAVHLRHESTDAVDQDGRLLAAAVWDPPNQWQAPPLRQVAMLLRMVPALGRHLPSALRGFSALGVVDKQHPREPHWYLAFLGTEPAAQGNGYGRALLDSRLAHCDETGAAAYLESSKQSNVGYYERFGFVLTGEIELPGDGPTLYPMWREPR